jgi:hypothetical protein
MSPARLAWARRLFPLVAWGLLRESPELVALLGRDEIIRRAMAADVDAAARPYADRFVFAPNVGPPQVEERVASLPSS